VLKKKEGNIERWQNSEVEEEDNEVEEDRNRIESLFFPPIQTGTAHIDTNCK
jgi:hypothetical protein